MALLVAALAAGEGNSLFPLHPNSNCGHEGCCTGGSCPAVAHGEYGACCIISGGMTPCACYPNIHPGECNQTCKRAPAAAPARRDALGVSTVAVSAFATPCGQCAVLLPFARKSDTAPVLQQELLGVAGFHLLRGSQAFHPGYERNGLEYNERQARLAV